VDSNDNFALHSYWDKLVRLPIKIGTLDFQEINNEYLKETYGAVVPSDKVNDAISRSYEITKYFGKQHSGSID
jgi:predicted solute-binding protein